jgi:curved DNA-binding protein CbpA
MCGRVPRDPYEILGVDPTASSEELHDAYRRLVKLHHPDRNGGSAEATRRFQDIQAAYEEIGRLRAARPAPTQPRPRPASDPSVEARIADLEREVREAQAAKAAAEKAARDAVRAQERERPSDDELGYVTTDDSFGKILSDVADEIADGLSGARRHPSVQRLEDLIDHLIDDDPKR